MTIGGLVYEVKLVRRGEAGVLFAKAAFVDEPDNRDSGGFGVVIAGTAADPDLIRCLTTRDDGAALGGTTSARTRPCRVRDGRDVPAATSP